MSSHSLTCGEATMHLLGRYGVSTVFGIPGVHTLDFCRGLHDGIRHVQARNEQGAGLMAEGWARATGQPGVALVISGPGVTNAATALAQAYADSLPVLLISAEPASRTLGKGWGVLHEVTEQKKITEPLTALSATARHPDDIPELLARAFTLFASSRPRPVHISVPVDVQAMTVPRVWPAVSPPGRPAPDSELIQRAAERLRGAKLPVIVLGGGAAHIGHAATALAEQLGAAVVTSTAGKGIVPDTHPLSLSAALMRPQTQALLAQADVILAIGTELSETESFVDRLTLNGSLIRVDLDPLKINDCYRATVGIVADARKTAIALMAALRGHSNPRGASAMRTRLAAIDESMMIGLSNAERQHVAVLDALRAVAPDDLVWSGDACQLVYTGAFAMPVSRPRQWFYPAGYCTLGNALPNAVGAKLALPDSPVAALVGDGGFMFTMPELLTAAELGLALPIVIWQNHGLNQIRDDMDAAGIRRVGVDGINPDFVALAKACHCHGVEPATRDALQHAFTEALRADRPTLIVVDHHCEWLREA